MPRPSWLLQLAMCVGLLAPQTAAARSGKFKALHSFQGGTTDGADPESNLTLLHGRLYGTTRSGGVGCRQYLGCGTLYSIDPKTGSVATVYLFKGGGDGAYPVTAPVAVDGKLYGTTELGGGDGCYGRGCGTIYSFDPSTGAESVIYASFSDAGGNAWAPYGNPLAIQKTLYGISGGGARHKSAVYSFDLTKATLKVVYSFSGGADGGSPNPTLTEVNGLLYGTTSTGGKGTDCFSTSCGTVFAVDPASGHESVVYSFLGGEDAAEPMSGLTNVGQLFYGVTDAGGCPQKEFGCGTIYSIDLTTGKEKVLYVFPEGINGMPYPRSDLTALHGVLYGTTFEGGAYGRGSIYAFDPKTNAIATLYSFDKARQGQYPVSAVLNLGRAFYGAAAGKRGGDYRCFKNCGAVYKFVP